MKATILTLMTLSIFSLSTFAAASTCKIEGDEVAVYVLDERFVCESSGLMFGQAVCNSDKLSTVLSFIPAIDDEDNLLLREGKIYINAKKQKERDLERGFSSNLKCVDTNPKKDQEDQEE